MLNKKRQGFTLMEIVLVMVLIAILATGVAIGFTSYINRGHETGITTDFNSTFKNPVRMEAIEKGKLPTLVKLKETIIADGFLANTETGWQTTVTDSDVTFGVEKGNKRYQVIYQTGIDIDGTGTAEAVDGIIVRADHSIKQTSVVYALNTAKNDVITVLGTSTVAEGVVTFTADVE